jgi:hypothetical protein
MNSRENGSLFHKGGIKTEKPIAYEFTRIEGCYRRTAVNSGTATKTAQMSTAAASSPTAIVIAKGSRCGAIFDRIRLFVDFEPAKSFMVATRQYIPVRQSCRSILSSPRQFEFAAQWASSYHVK